MDDPIFGTNLINLQTVHPSTALTVYVDCFHANALDTTDMASLQPQRTKNTRNVCYNALKTHHAVCTVR